MSSEAGVESLFYERRKSQKRESDQPCYEAPGKILDANYISIWYEWRLL